MINIPSRQSSAMTGSEFIKKHMSTPRFDREADALKEILNGNVPDFWRSFKEVKVTSGSNELVYLASPDYICIGSDDDYLRFCFNVESAQKIADAFDMTLPTSLMVDQIWKVATIKLEPIPFGPPYNSEMFSTSRFQWSNDKINKQLEGKDKTQLIAGHKKDLVLSNFLAPNNPKLRVCIYGWHKKDGIVIQGENPKDHERNYQDYSQAPRFIYKDVYLNGKLERIENIFNDNELSKMINKSGKLLFQRY